MAYGMQSNTNGINFIELLTNFYPIMLDRSITEEQVHNMMVENPANFLDK